MTEHRPPACHYDRTLGERVTREHRDDCPSRGDGHTHDCPGDHGCAPCTAHHCTVCGREHVTNDQPVTCPSCEGKVAQDLRDIRNAYALLATEAMAAGTNGQLVAAAPIPGGNAAVMIGPTVRLDMLRTGRGYTSEDFAEDHPVSKKTGRPVDPLPPLAILAQWEDIYRTWLQHNRTTTATTITRAGGAPMTVPARATIGRAIGYLLDQVPYLAQRTDGPDWLEFTRQVRDLRATCERALHDEREPEHGVACFECSDTLVRRFRTRVRCEHDTPARAELARLIAASEAAQERLRIIRTYPELPVRIGDLTATNIPAAAVTAARRPCAKCTDQGGLKNPAAGESWECPGCRKEYDPKEYAHAVRRSLLDTEGMGWCTLPTAAEAAADLTGRPITAATIRTWAERGDDIALACLWREGHRFGVQLVYWPDVAQRATEDRRRGRRKAS